MVAFAYNSAVQETTQLSPYHILHDREPRFSAKLALGTATYTGPGLSKASLSSEIKSNFRQIFDLTKENISIKQHKMMRYANKTRPFTQFQVEDKVWLYIPHKTSTICDEDKNEFRRIKKLKFFWQGSYKITKQVSPNIMELRYSNGHRLGQNVHISRLKHYKEHQPEEIPELDENDDFDPIEE